MNSLTSPVDIRPDHLEIVQDILREHLPAGVKVWVFGSRANWTTKDSSDLDLALEGESKLSHKMLGALKDAFEDSTLPYTVDVVDLNAVGHAFEQIVKEQRVPFPALSASSGSGHAWTRVPLDDVIDLQLSSVDKKSKANEQAVQLCNYMDVYNNNFIRADMGFMVATATEREIARCSLAAGDVVITKDSEKHDDIGVPALVREDVPDLICGYHLAILRPSASEIDGAYLFYALSTDEAQRQFHSYANGITRFGLRKADIGLVEIPLPPLPEQRAIAHVLGTLDDKVELNRRMNETLEAMARALFKSWFVDFEPVRAKMDGRWRRGESLPGLPAEHYDLFPDRLVDSELGETPEGWAVGVLNDAIELLSGGTPKTSIPGYWGGDIPWYTAKDAPNGSDVFALETERTITQSGVENSATRILPAGTTVITARGTVGRLACLGVPMAMNQTCYGIRGAHGYPDFFTYWNLRTAVDELQTRTHGTIFDTITRQTFALVEMALAPVKLTLAFEAIVEPIMAHILNNLKESRSLAARRDELLPRLVSGEVGVVASAQGSH